MSTIQDVAKHAHVGVATVSRVLNGKGYVKDTTREKVLTAIRELNYTPNELAKNLFQNRNGIIALIVPEVSYPFFAEFANAVEAALCKYGFQMMLCNTWYEKNNEIRLLEMLKQRRVDGLIVGSHALDVDVYQNVDRPIVALDRDLGNEIPCVSVDHELGGKTAAEELIRAGCKEVVQICGNELVKGPFADRHTVFEQMMKEKKIICHSITTKWNEFEYSYFQNLAYEILDKYPDADGYFSTDLTSLSIIRAATEKGKKYPQDYKIVSYDGTKICGLVSPNLTLIVQPIVFLAQECVRLVVEQIQGEKIKERHVSVKTELRRGLSTMPEK